MKSLLLGATGFIGTNLALSLLKLNNNLKLVGKVFTEEYKRMFDNALSDVSFVESFINVDTEFDTLISDVDTVYHLISSCVPANSNENIEKNIVFDIRMTIKLLDSMVRNKCAKIIFISSGGAIYGNMIEDDKNELSYTSPVSAYGIQKLTIEKIIYLYNYLYGIDYRIIRLGNPYGRFQKANTGQGIIPTLIEDAIVGKAFTVYGDGTNKRDYIYIDDAVSAILNISNNSTKYKLYNVGSGVGISINEIIKAVSEIVNKSIDVKYVNSRSSDVKDIYLNTDRYKKEFGNPAKTSLHDGILNTFKYIKGNNNV